MDGEREAEVGKRRVERGEFQTPAVAIGHHAKTFLYKRTFCKFIIDRFLENFKLISVVFGKFLVSFR